MDKIIFYVVSLLVLFKVSSIRACCKNDIQKEWYAPSFPIKAIAVLRGEVVDTNNNNVTNQVRGIIEFIQNEANGAITINLNASGLITKSPGKQGLHIHQYGLKSTSDKVTDICGSSGAHYNPTNVLHGDISSTIRHVGDLGNVNRDNGGNIVTTFTDNVIQLYGPYSVIGRTIVLHALEDDLGKLNTNASQTTGNSGARVACGVIGYEA